MDFEGILASTGCSKKNGTQVNGYKPVAIRSNHLEFGDHNVEGLCETHTKNQVNQFNNTDFRTHWLKTLILRLRQSAD